MRLRVVTFDCWDTLLFEREPGATWARRVELLAEAARRQGTPADLETARRALERAWERHWRLWHEGVASGAPEMAAWALAALTETGGAPPPGAAAAQALGRAFGEMQLEADVRALEGAPETLERLARAGIRRALVCDTGFSPGATVRRLLAREGLLDLLEVTVFSDEAGVPKPDPRVFRRALEPLGLAERPQESVHVGDLRRTDVAGGRGFGMGTVRIRARHDDTSDLPEADRVADSHAHLLDLLPALGWDER